jgi:hypothetical protein
MGAGFRRDPSAGGRNAALNYGYAVLRACVARAVVASGLNPAIGIFHANRHNPLCLVDDLMEPFRPCVDWRVAQWIKKPPTITSWEVTPEYRKWITGFPTTEIDYFGLQLDIRSCIEGVIRSFRKALIEQQTGPYKPWTHKNSKWAG